MYLNFNKKIFISNAFRLIATYDVFECKENLLSLADSMRLIATYDVFEFKISISIIVYIKINSNIRCI